MKIFLLTFVSIVHLAVGQNECLPARCSPFGPDIRFPFRLKDHQAEHCGYPGFELSCKENGIVRFDLQYPVTASANNIVVPVQMTVTVGDIDYKAQKMLASGAKARSCLPGKLPTLNSSASPFEVEAIDYYKEHTLFNCSDTQGYQRVACLSNRNYKVMAFPSNYVISGLPPYSSCSRMYSISYVPDDAFTGRDDDYGTRFYLRWSRPFCGNCEAKGEYCRLKNGGTAEETECFSSQQHGIGASRNHKLLVAGITGGIVLVAFITIPLFFILRAMRRKIDDRKRIEKVLADHKHMRPRRFSYADIKRCTKIFKGKLGQGSYGTLHKGMLADGTPVFVKVLSCWEQNVEDFISGVERIGRMQHMNVLQLIGYCVDGSKRALVYEFLQSGTLETLVSSENQSHGFGLEKLLQIPLGIAKGVDYVHQECTPENLILDISPQSILLDHNMNPRILVSTKAARGSIDYIAPELFSCSSDIIPQKADAYSFGMLLLDIVGRRRHLEFGEKESCEVYFPEWFYNQLENSEERAIQIEEEEVEEHEIVKKLSIVGLWCIHWFPSDRPSIKAAIQMLEGDNVPALPPNPFASSDLNTQK